jgi:hypothetical protein
VIAPLRPNVILIAKLRHLVTKMWQIVTTAPLAAADAINS